MGVTDRIPQVAPAAATLGGGLLVAGSLAEWSGVAYSSQLDRMLMLAAGAATIAIALLAIRRGARTLSWAILPGLLALNMAVVNINDIATHSYEYRADPEAYVGWGLYVGVAGALVVLGVAVLHIAATLRSRRGRGAP